jgi:hypothetical protein
VVSAGNFEHEKLTLFGKDPLVGLTSRLKIAGWPAGSDVLPGVIPIVNSKVWLGVALNVTGTEWEIAARSVPPPVILKL